MWQQQYPKEKLPMASSHITNHPKKKWTDNFPPNLHIVTIVKPCIPLLGSSNFQFQLPPVGPPSIICQDPQDGSGTLHEIHLGYVANIGEWICFNEKKIICNVPFVSVNSNNEKTERKHNVEHFEDVFLAVFPVYLHVFPANLFKVMGTCDSGVCTNKPVNSSSVSSVCGWDFPMQRISQFPGNFMKFGWISHISIFHQSENTFKTQQKSDAFGDCRVFFFSAWPEKLMKSVHPFHLSFDWLSEWLPNQDKILEIILLLFGCFWVIFGLRGSLRSFFAWKHHPQTSSPERFCTAAHCRTPRYPCKPRIQCDVVTWGGWNDTETYRQGNTNNEKKHENIV